jgi:hypothetical protein
MRISRSKGQEKAGICRQLHTAELNKLLCSQSRITHKIVKTGGARRAWHATHVGETIKTQGDLVGNHEGKNIIGRQRRMLHSNIKSDFQKIGLRSVVCIYDLKIWNSVARFWIKY